MGNYFEGNLFIVLKKDIPKELKDALIQLSNCNEKTIPTQYAKEPCFQHERWNYPSFSFGYLAKADETDIVKYIDIEYEEYHSCENDDFELKKEYDKILEKFCAYYVEIRFCMKGYQKLGELYVDWLRPYMDLNKDFNYLGEIEDEDSTYHKKFYANEELLKQEENQRNYLCKDCPNKIDGLCDFYSICKRAYNIGKNS